eukprot:3944344-Pyramimonas_sp.AAC.1
MRSGPGHQRDANGLRRGRTGHAPDGGPRRAAPASAARCAQRQRQCPAGQEQQAPDRPLPGQGGTTP